MMLLHAVNTAEEMIASSIFRLHAACEKANNTHVTCNGREMVSLCDYDDAHLLGELIDMLKDCCEIRTLHAGNKLKHIASGQHRKCAHKHEHGNMHGYEHSEQMGQHKHEHSTEAEHTGDTYLGEQRTGIGTLRGL